MAWGNLPANLENRIVSEISAKDKMDRAVIPKEAKYKNIKIEKYGYKWDSLKEVKRYEDLMLLATAGEIKYLIVHPRYLILDTLRDNGITYRKRYYVADFEYCDGYNVIVEDVKSKATSKLPLFTIKRHLLLERYKGQYIFRIYE